MANYNKNLFVGIGGSEAINLSHFIGAVRPAQSFNCVSYLHPNNLMLHQNTHAFW